MTFFCLYVKKSVAYGLFYLSRSVNQFGFFGAPSWGKSHRGYHLDQQLQSNHAVAAGSINSCEDTRGSYQQCLAPSLIYHAHIILWLLHSWGHLRTIYGALYKRSCGFCGERGGRVGWAVLGKHRVTNCASCSSPLPSGLSELPQQVYQPPRRGFYLALLGPHCCILASRGSRWPSS